MTEQEFIDMSCPRKYADEANDASLNRVGLGMAYAGAFFVALGLALQNLSIKKEHVRDAKRSFTIQPIWLSGLASSLVGYGSLAAALGTLPVLVFVTVVSTIACWHIIFHAALLGWRPPFLWRDTLMATVVVVAAIVATYYGNWRLTCEPTSQIQQIVFSTRGGLVIGVAAIIVFIAWLLLLYIERILQSGASMQTPVMVTRLPSDASAPRIQENAAQAEPSPAVIRSSKSALSLPRTMWSFFRRMRHRLLGPWFTSMMPFTQPAYFSSFGSHNPWETAHKHLGVSVLPLSGSSSVSIAAELGNAPAQTVHHSRERSNTAPAVCESPAIDGRVDLLSVPQVRANTTDGLAPSNTPKEKRHGHRRRSTTDMFVATIRKATHAVRNQAVNEALLLQTIDTPPQRYLPFGRAHPCSYAIIMAVLASWLLLATKCVLEIWKAVYYDHDEGGVAKFIGSLLVLSIFSLLCQHYAARALQLFDAPYVLPLYYAIWMAVSCSFAALILKETEQMTTKDGTMVLASACFSLLATAILMDQSSTRLPLHIPVQGQETTSSIPKDVPTFQNLLIVGKNAAQSFLNNGWQHVISEEGTIDAPEQRVAAFSGAHV